MIEALWGEEFEIKETPKLAKKLLTKIKEPKQIEKSVEKQIKSKALSYEDRIALIKDKVSQVLSKQVDNVQVIRSKDDFHEYISRCIDNKIVAIDTETNNSLDPITCKLMGLCLYSTDLKQAYIPVNHIDRLTGKLLPDQLTESDIREELSRLSNTFTVTHNGKFDYQVLKETCGIEIRLDWDTYIGARLLDENEPSAGLKEQYIDKIDPSQEKYDIEYLFENEKYAWLDPDLFALYSATDSFMTLKLYEWQKARFEAKENEKVYNLAKELEMPLVKVIAEMELRGMEVDQEYAELLSKKYHKLLDNLDEKINEELNILKPQIDAWKLTDEANTRPKKKSGEGEGKSKAEQLTDPINTASPTQLAILLYDVLKCPQVSKKSPRGTGEAELEALAEKKQLKICKLLLERRGYVKLISTYIDVIPETAKIWPDGRVRTHFNQCGADTGRLSSGGKIAYTDANDETHKISGINFQNIPSSNREIRMLFRSKDRYKICGADYQAQEPRLTAFYSQDENMINAYKEGKDLYSVIASMSFDRKYEDCLEFYPEGTVIDYEGQKVVCGHKTHQNKEGKHYRSISKSILLGVLYGRGAASVGAQIGKTKEEAQEIIDKFFKTFPKVKKWIDTSIENAHKYGYVEDIAGRRRRLPDILKSKYELTPVKSNNIIANFNPLLYCENKVNDNTSKIIGKYQVELEKVRSRKDYEIIQQKALTEGIEIHDNTGFIAQAERQAVNSRVQGGAASLTKKALLDIYYDEKLRSMGAYLINTVHDEILLEVPDAYMHECADRLCEIMINSAKKYISNVPMGADAYITNCWYLDEFNALVKDEFKKLLEDKHMDPMDAFEYMCEYRSESTRDQIYELVGEFLPRMPENVKIIHTLTE